MTGFYKLATLPKLTSKFEWTLDNIRIEKIISAQILDKEKKIFEISALLAVRQCPKLQSWAILGKCWENDKNPTLILNPIWGLRNLFQGFYLDNVWSYHPMQFPGKLMNQTWENGKKPVSRLILAPFAQIWVHKIFFMDFITTTC